MKVMKNFFLLVFVFTVILAGNSFAIAGERVDDGAELEVTFEDLNLREPRILSGDALYFLKNWQRGIQRFFSFGDLRKAAFHSGVMNKLAAEIKVLKEEGNNETLNLALRSYRENAECLEEKISSLSESGENSQVDGFLNTLTDRFVKHEEIFRKLEGLTGVEEELKKAKEELEMAAATAIIKLDSPEGFKNRMESTLQSFKENHLRELRVVYVLNYIEEKLPEEIRGKIRELETDLISRFEGRFKAEPEEVIPYLNFLPIKSARDLSVFDEVRERVTDGRLKSELNIVRQGALKNGNGDILEEEAILGIIWEAEMAAEELEKRISSEDYVSSKSVEELLERAQFHLTQANELLGEGESRTAFGQATAAQATAENGLSQILPRDELEKGNLSLRIQFDKLVGVARAKNLTRRAVPELYDRFDEVEEIIIGAGTATELRNAKIMLAEIEVIIINNNRK